MGKSAEAVETDAAIAAADLVQKLEKGLYMLPDGRRRKINNDASKLIFAVGLGDLQRKLLADFRFRCRAIPGTQEIRTKIGHLGLWACVNYGNGIFCTVSPGERHNYLALKLSRYPSSSQGTTKWPAKFGPTQNTTIQVSQTTVFVLC